LIQIYEKNTVKPEENGVMPLFPKNCTLQAALNGAWTLTLEHSLDQKERWKYIEEESIVSVPTFMGKRQLFRIDKIEKNNYGVSAIGYPIFYDAAKEVFLLDTRPTDKNGQEALDLMLKGSKYSGKSDITAASTAYFERRNMLDAINGTDSPTFLERWGGEVLYDNYTVIINKRAGGEYGVEVRYGKNMSGLTYTVDMSNIMTRIVPVAYNGRMISGSSPWVDSSNINKYATVYIKEVKFEDVKLIDDLESTEDTEENIIICKNQTELETALKNKCKEEYQNGADLPVVSLEVDMVQLSKTDEYADVKMLEQVSLGDTVRCRHKKLDITTDARVVEIKWDCIKNTVSSVKLGDTTQTYFEKVSSAVDAINSIVNKQSKTVMAEKIKGVLNAINTQLRYQKNVAQKQDVRAILFEDTDKESSTYGAMCLGTQGFQIANTRTQDGRDWDWKTAFTAEGGYADTLILGILSDRTGKNFWNLNTGEFQLASSVSVDGKGTLKTLAEDSLTQEQIFNLLTNKGAVKGIYKIGNELYINMSYIKAGTMALGGSQNDKGVLEIYDENDKLKAVMNKEGIQHYDAGETVPYHYRTEHCELHLKYRDFAGGGKEVCTATVEFMFAETTLSTEFLNYWMKYGSSAMKITASIKKIDSPGAPSSSGIYALGTFGVGDIELYFDDIRTPCIKVNVECSYINYGFNNLSPRYIAPNQLYLDVDIVY
jgi:phage minor structural protein